MMRRWMMSSCFCCDCAIASVALIWARNEASLTAAVTMFAVSVR